MLTLTWALSRYATVSGKRLFIAPNLMNKISRVPEKIVDRKTEVVRRTNYLDRDTIQFNVPESLYPEFLPESGKNKFKVWGVRSAFFNSTQAKIIYVRKDEGLEGPLSKGNVLRTCRFL